MKKILRMLTTLLVMVGVLCAATGCVPRKLPAQDSSMSATEYLKSSDRADWLNKQLKSASLTIRDGKLGRDSDASPGKIVTPLVTMEVEVRRNGQPNFRRPVRIALESTNTYPSISFEIRGDGSWDACLGTSGCSSSLAGDGMSTDELIKHDDKAVETLNEVLDSLVRPA